jgi:hypothetical protein
MINLGVRHLLPRDWRYVAWVDCDVEFRVDGWAQEALYQLQHYPLIQPWQQCVDLGYSGNVMSTYSSFGFLTTTGTRIQKTSTEPYPYGHSGYAWAATRAWWEQSGGLMDFAILGAADHHMAWAAVNNVETSVHGAMAPSYLRRCQEWQARTMRVTRGRVGYSAGRIEHAFHGPKARRYYKERWQILADHSYDPDKHLAYNSDGVVEIVDNIKLEQAISAYNRSRCEDSIEES